MAETAVPLDGADQPVHPALAWHDQRGVDEAERFVATVGTERLYAITGLAPRHIFGLYKLLWLRANVPDAVRIRRWLNMADFVAYWLSGEQAMDPSLATRTSVFDVSSNRLSPDLLSAAEVAESLFAPVTESGTSLGRVRAQVAEVTGLPRDAVVAVGGHDHPCGALAMGLLTSTAILDSLGTAESVFAVTDTPVLDARVARSGYEQGRHVVPGRYYAMGGVYTSGVAIDWAADILGLTGAARQAELIQLAGDAPPGSRGVLFLPHLRMASPPHNDPRSRGAFVGLTDVTGRAEMARAVVEGLAYEFYLTSAGLVETFAIPAKEVVVTGGGAGNALGLDIKRQLVGLSMRRADDEQAASRGAAMLAGIGAGVFDDAEAAVAKMRCPTEVVEGDNGDAGFYREVYDTQYRSLYEQLATIHHASSPS